VHEIVHETRGLIAPLVSGRDVQFDRGQDPQPDWHVLADRQRLKQVLLNLLANAIKYNRKGGTVGLSYTRAPGPRLGIQVIDTGPGIAADKLARIFTPFDRLGAEQTGIEGTGLGLALSKRLVEAMGGTLSIHSVVGQGSTFSVEFPQVDAPTAQLERMEAAPWMRTESAATGLSRVVLYIEDNPSNLKLVARLLEARPKVRLIPALQGRLGLTLAREHRPDVILLDLHLPDISGEEILVELQRDPRTRGIPVVVTSADATRDRIERLRAAGVKDYLTKPVDVKRLLAVLDDTLVERAS
jgi:CheY-like chemotaxis protein